MDLLQTIRRLQYLDVRKEIVCMMKLMSDLAARNIHQPLDYPRSPNPIGRMYIRYVQDMKTVQKPVKSGS